MAKINTKHMFLERVSPEDRDKHKPPYTMQETDVTRGSVQYLSMYKLYMSSVDEYDFAETHLGGIPLWNHLLRTQWFVEGYRCHRGLDAWREDMLARDKSTAKKVLMLAAAEGDTSAARKLFDASEKELTAVKKTNKTKTKAAKATKVDADREFLDNAAMRLNVVSIRD